MAVLLGIVITAASAFFFPRVVLVMKPFLAPAFAITMILVGTFVRSEQWESFFESPVRPLVGLIGQYTIMPLTAWMISLGFDDPALRTGVILVGCMPGAMASNVMTLLFKGDLILSVTLTTLATLTCPVIIAFWLPLLADTRLPVPTTSLV